MSFEDKLNIYTCTTCGHHIVTKDLVEGVTPFMVSCEADGCKGKMESSFYRVFDQRMKPSHEWYRPKPKQKLTFGELGHVEKGGLLLRKIET